MKNREILCLDSLKMDIQKRYKLTTTLVLFFSVFIFKSTLAQSALEERIRQVENGLTENIQTSDSAPFNLLERMKHFKVQGLSIAVIKDYKVDFAKGYGFAIDPVKPKIFFS